MFKDTVMWAAFIYAEKVDGFVCMHAERAIGEPMQCNPVH
ncbi:protein of unknown function [Candidatus Filomicrobium marinum]|uniref:Uncharacterized protein n=1 Tax=Candidatus Filomicrobium marinum TaxID=1608628 RepID=A0A0D6JK84_9HYPH|nr:protein of unknown function [Candidatus Filomicrobium marinum]CPR22366.1 protein of unknown function [Candidatus Filomicrobium marinum]